MAGGRTSEERNGRLCGGEDSEGGNVKAKEQSKKKKKPQLKWTREKKRDMTCATLLPTEGDTSIRRKVPVERINEGFKGQSSHYRKKKCLATEKNFQ